MDNRDRLRCDSNEVASDQIHVLQPQTASVSAGAIESTSEPSFVPSQIRAGR